LKKYCGKFPEEKGYQMQSLKPTEEKENLWNKILVEASRSIADRPEPKTIIMLGNNF
jgi:hypothetical protein